MKGGFVFATFFFELYFLDRLDFSNHSEKW